MSYAQYSSHYVEADIYKCYTDKRPKKPNRIIRLKTPHSERGKLLNGREVIKVEEKWIFVVKPKILPPPI